MALIIARNLVCEETTAKSGSIESDKFAGDEVVSRKKNSEQCFLAPTLLRSLLKNEIPVMRTKEIKMMIDTIKLSIFR